MAELPSFAGRCRPSQGGGGGLFARGQDPSPWESYQLLGLQKGRGCVTAPDAISIVGEKKKHWGDPLYILQVYVSNALSTAPLGTVWKGLPRKLGPRGALPIMRFLLGAECTTSWCPAQGRRRISLRKRGIQDTTEIRILRGVVLGEGLRPPIAS